MVTETYTLLVGLTEINKRSMKKEKIVLHESNLWRIAWETYKNSPDYYSAINAMMKVGMKQPYIDNILNSTFAAGYNSIR